MCNGWCEGHLDIGVLVCSGYLHLLIRIELRLLTVLFLNKTILRVAELDKSTVEL
jgi:hypothetical protein